MLQKPMWNLINPSDAITFRATEEEAAVMNFALMRNLLFVQNAETNEDAPVDQDQSLYRAIKDDPDRLESLADAWGSFLCGDPADRLLFEEAVAVMTPEQAEAFRESYQDRKRTSMNDICARAYEVSGAFRKLAADLRAKAGGVDG